MAEASILDFQLRAIMDSIVLASVVFLILSIFVFGLFFSNGGYNE